MTSSGDPATPTNDALMRGIAWTGSLRWIAQLAAWASTLVLVRILHPSDYGVVAVAAAITLWLTLLSDFGLAGLIISGDLLSQEDQQRLHGMSLCIGLLLFTVLALSSRFVAEFFRQPELVRIVPVLAACILFDSYRNVQSAVMTRTLRNRELAIVDLARSLTQTTAVILLAALGFRFWSLVLGQVLASLVGTIGVSLRVRLSPRLPRHQEFKRFRERGRLFLINNLTWQTYSSADTWVLGRTFAAADVGIYGIAKTLAFVPIDKLVTIITSVTPGYFANARDNESQLRKFFLLMTQAVSLVVALPLAGLAFTADLTVPVVLGERWIAAVEPLRFLCVGAFLWTLSMIALQVATLSTELRAITAASIVAVPVSFLSYGVASRYFGLAGVAAAWILVVLVVAVPTVVVALRRSRTTVAQLLLSYWDAVKATIAIGIATSVARWIAPISWSPRSRLALLVLAGAVAGLLTVWTSSSPLIKSARERLRARWRGGESGT